MINYSTILFVNYKKMAKTVSIFSLAIGVIFGLNYLVKKQNPNLSIISPLSKSFSILALTNRRDTPKKIIYGYLPYWTIGQTEYLQYDKLTDIAYFGLHIDAQGNFIKLTENNELHPGYNNWRNSQDLKIVIENCRKYGVNFALTIISHQDDISDKFLDCRECWDKLAENVIRELIEYNITDLNLNFEYVEFTPKEKAEQYTQFVQFMNERLDKEFVNSKLVVSTFADSIVKERITRIESLGKAADQIFIMAYDFHRPNSDNAGPVSPIDGKGIHAEYDLRTMLKDYLAYVPPSKLIMGVPYYGYNWVVGTDEDYGERIEGSDEIGYSQSQTYEAVMETIIKLKPEIKWDELAKVPHFTYISPETKKIRHVYYENSESLGEKYDLINTYNLAGVGIWALGYDGGYRELWTLLENKFID